MDETATIATDGEDIDVRNAIQKDFITNLAYHFYSAFGLETVEDGAFGRVLDMLPALLKAFSIRLNASDGLLRDAMVFIRHYRGYYHYKKRTRKKY